MVANDLAISLSITVHAYMQDTSSVHYWRMGVPESDPYNETSRLHSRTMDWGMWYHTQVSIFHFACNGSNRLAFSFCKWQSNCPVAVISADLQLTITFNFYTGLPRIFPYNKKAPDLSKPFLPPHTGYYSINFTYGYCHFHVPCQRLSLYNIKTNQFRIT